MRRTIHNLIAVALWVAIIALLWWHDGCAALGYR